MVGSLDDPSIIIRQSRLKLTLRFAPWLLLTLFLILLAARQGDLAAVGLEFSGTASLALMYAGLFVFALIVAVAVATLISPAVLRLDPQGFSYSGLWGTKQFAWDDVEKFDVRSSSVWHKEVIYNMSQWYLWQHPHEVFPLGSFGASWPMSAKELAARLNAAKAAWGMNRLLRGPDLRRVA